MFAQSSVHGPIQGEPFHPGREPAPERAEPPRRRRSFTVPLLALTATLLVLAAAIVVIFGFGDDREAGVDSVDSCVVGTWTVVDMAMELPTAEFGVISLTNATEAGRMRFGANGKGYHDYGAAAQFDAEVTDAQGKRKVTLRISGVTTFGFHTQESTLSYLDVESSGQMTLTVPATGASSSADLPVTADPAKYSCEGDVLTVYTEEQRATARRSGV